MHRMAILALILGVVVGGLGVHLLDGRDATAEGTWQAVRFDSRFYWYLDNADIEPDPSTDINAWVGTLSASCDLEMGVTDEDIVVLYRCP